MSKVIVSKQLLDDINDAISVASGDVKNRTLTEMANSIPSGGGGDGEKSVNFYDYDGSLVAAYSKTELDALTQLPENPFHEGLTAQGWNWNLADLKSYMSSYPSAVITVGQMYVTTSGKTEIDVVLDDENYLSPYIFFAPNGTVEIDWGDGSTVDTVTGNNDTILKYTQHTYSSTGNYTIKLNVTSGKFIFYGNGTSNAQILSDKSSTSYNKKYSSCIIKIRMGNNAIMGNYSFANCYNLSSIAISSSAATAIGNYTFYYCINLKYITLPSELKTINGSGSFDYCYSLKSVAIPSGTTYIYNNAFNHCYSLKSVAIPSGTTQVNGFGSCYSLTNINIPNTVKELYGTFNNCSVLNNITIPSGTTSFRGSVFQNCYILKNNIIIPSGTTHISQSMFQGCYTIKKVTFASPSTVRGLGNYAFSNCYNLSEMSLPSGTTAIGQYAFQTCYSLRKIIIPGTVSTIGTNAFNSCHSMQEYHFQSTTVPGIPATNVFAGIPTNCKIYVPSASLDAYKTADYWSTFADYMVGE